METLTKRLAEFILEATGDRVIRVRKLPVGVNSAIYKVETAQHNAYIAKRYIRKTGDTRDRLRTEYEGLAFLWQQGIRTIPAPIVMDKANNTGIYGFLPGLRMRVPTIRRSDTVQAAEFLHQLYLLRNARGAGRQPVASEACFSLACYHDAIQEKLSALRRLPSHTPSHVALQTFLKESFTPAFSRISQWITQTAASQSLDTTIALPRRLQTLSPTDFCFRNCLRSKDGTLNFLDFEYWGWDDPAKTIANFFLHPAVPLPYSHRHIFFDRLYPVFRTDPGFVRRLPLIYCYLSLKWSLIMLNPYLQSKETPILTTQLTKAKKQLAATVRDIQTKRFPVSLVK